MLAAMSAALLFYIGGVVVGLLLTDGSPVERLALALLWPLGPLAFIVTVAILLAAAMIAFPVFGVTAAAVGAAAWWWLG
jgi:hypothetical protein